MKLTLVVLTKVNTTFTLWWSDFHSSFFLISYLNYQKTCTQLQISDFKVHVYGQNLVDSFLKKHLFRNVNRTSVFPGNFWSIYFDFKIVPTYLILVKVAIYSIGKLKFKSCRKLLVVKTFLSAWFDGLTSLFKWLCCRHNSYRFAKQAAFSRKKVHSFLAGALV